MNRTPPTEVRKALRQEVGFGCPVPNCGCPYLEWRHFDPPWKQEKHHNPDGMIALCREHHIQADYGAFTIAQLHEFKENGLLNWQQVSGKFNWLRNRLLAVVGGNFYYETPVIFQFRDRPIIWLERDINNYLMLNLVMLTTSGEPRAYMNQNEWFNTGIESDIECPPSAKHIKIEYPNGDLLKIDFFELHSLEDAQKKYPSANVSSWQIDFPITAVEVVNSVANSNIEFSAGQTRAGGLTMVNCFMSYCGAGLVLS